MSNIKDLTGTKLGKLTLSKRKRENNRTYYYCECECGTNKWIRADLLNRVTSCGCAREYNFRDLTGNKFGMLTPKKIIGTSKDNGKIWSCKCDCGNYKDIALSALISGATISCGCYQKEIAKNSIKKANTKFKENNMIENTNISYLYLNAPIRSNKSGVTGVCFSTNQQKWIANISFQKKRYFLGYFETKEEAAKVRKKAEENYHKSFLEWYKKEYKKE